MTSELPQTLPDTLGTLARVFAALGRDELAQRTAAAIARTTRPATVICVVGEFKQGKSSLVNMLVGVDVCPVDDDLATAALTIVRHGPQITARVVHRSGDGADAATATVDVAGAAELAEWVTEAGNPGNERGVERVELTAPGRLLADGVMIVDTPGAGGMHAGQAAATLAFLPFADGLIFASDATSELTAPEVEFLRAAAERCPTVVMALTKIDLQPEWRRIADIDQAHLAAAGLDIPVVGVSATLHRAARDTGDAELDALSGCRGLVAAVGTRVVGPARADAGTRAANEALAAIGHVTAALAAERGALSDPAANAAALEAAETAQARLAHLQGPAARWQQVVGDRTSDLANHVVGEFRGAVRDLTRAMDERIEQLRSPDEFTALGADLQAATADAVAAAFAEIETGRQAIREELAALIGADLPTDAAGGADALDLGGLWDASARTHAGPSAGKRALQSGLGTLRGAQGGIIMFGMVGGFLPIAAGALLLSAPVMLGVGALFASMSFGDDRQRRLTARRQQARQQVRQFLDDVGYHASNRLNDLTRALPRELRDEFGELLAELHRTTRELLASAQAAAQQSADERATRVAAIDQQVAALDALASRLTVAGVPG